MKLLVSCAALLSLVHTSTRAPAQPESPPIAVPESQSVVAPVLLRHVPPVYPEQQRELGRSAVVVLVLTIDASGAVVDVSVEQSAGIDFDREALAIVPKLAFAPATHGGVPIKAKVPFRVVFELQPPPSAPETAARAPEPEPTPASAETLPSGVEFDEGLDVSVSGERPQLEPTRRELSGAEIRRIPGTNGDALRSLENMPGVARTPGLDSALIVRGSAPGDTKIFAEGVEIPLAYHFDGVSAVIPSEILERIDFYPGNFGPQYGRATGGVVGLGVRSPRKDRLGGLLQVDVLDGRILAEGPIDDSTRFLVAGRRSWVDAWLGPALSAGGMGVAVAPVYYDAQVMLEHDLSSTSRIRVFAFGAEDRLRLVNPAPSATDPTDGGSLAARTGFWRTQLSLDTRPTADVTWVSTLSVGQDRDQFSMGSIDVLTQAWQFSGRSDLRAKLSEKMTAVAGLDAVWSRYNANWRFPYVDVETGAADGPLFGRETMSIEADPDVVRPSAYALLEVTPVATLKVLPGVRANYDSDTRRATFEPRLSTRYELASGAPRTTLKGAVGVYYQPPDPYESLEPFGTPGVKSPHAMHYSLGVEQELMGPLEVSVEGFYKDLDDLVVSTPAVDSEAGGSAYQNSGSGRAYGGELLLRYKPVDRFFGWVAYTLSRSERRDAPDEPLTLFAVDQTHILTALGSYKLGAGWELGARFRYVTGTPYTPYLGGVIDFDAGAYAPVVSSKVNSVRGEPFHQLDVRVDKTWTFTSWKLGAYLDVRNAYNHRSSDQPIYNYDYSKAARFPGLPFVPVFGLRGEL